MKEHEYYTSCGTSDCGGSCMLCTLSVCKICGLMEGALTTHCLGDTVDDTLREEVYAGKLDFINGEWKSQCSPHSPAMHRKETNV